MDNRGKNQGGSSNHPSRFPSGTSQSTKRGASCAPPGASRYRVRPATPQDCPTLLCLIKEVAALEKRPHPVRLTEKDLVDDGFGPQPLFYCLLAEVPAEDPASGFLGVGFAIYYFTYDPWIGRVLFLEDFYVMKSYRGLGIGKEFLKKLSQVATSLRCACMQFLVNMRNQKSVDYYVNCGGFDLSSDAGWHLFRMAKDDLTNLATKESKKFPESCPKDLGQGPA
ncbi:spermidine/spermine N(1)-acetyltransferase-like protein 1 isoform X1 [Tachyglossus aculeatus]|uniref:spermidine/spermine N(1)-acetyltransferase-like protein 1 isoform X1 n=1 Tax=Tachyglossus aculeatus TaxID=9261 RepID=UPI0018F29337|nr:spermidine/spermine N(1)-acetyltransferase-like protein 1 isoform X1 [Tachyglossus aculeatus]